METPSAGAAAGCHTRELTADDLESGALGIDPFIRGNIGVEGANEYKQARLHYYNAWVIPAALLMTVSFGLVFAVSTDEIGSTPIGFPFERVVRSLAGHAYMLAMTTSALLALRCINTYSQQILRTCMLPATLIPHANRVWKDVRANTKHSDAIQTPDWVWQMQEPGEWETQVEELRRTRWPFQILKKLNVPDASDAFFAATECLSTGIALGAYLKYGPSYAMMLGIPSYITARELRFREQRDYRIAWKMAAASIDCD